MKRIRLGNDIQVVWSVSGAQSISADALSVSLYDRLDKKAVFSPIISVNSTTGVCTITGTFYGSDQKTTGTYRLLLQANAGDNDMVTLDHVEAFQLVGVCDFGIVEGLDNDNISTVVVELSDSLSTIVGNTDLSSFVTRFEFETGMATKEDVLTFDNAPTSGSDNPVKSGGVYTALAGKQDTIQDLAAIRSGAADGATAYQKPSTGIPTTDMSQSVQDALDDAATALQDAPNDGKQYARKDGEWTEVQTPSITVDPTPTQGSTNAVQSGGVYTALQGKQATLIAGTNMDTTPTANSANPITSGGVHVSVSALDTRLQVVEAYIALDQELAEI